MKNSRVASVVILFTLTLAAAHFFDAQNGARAIAVGWAVDAAGTAQKKQAQQSITITLLDTTDSHGHIEPWDYYTNQPANLGLAKIATLVKAVRSQAPDALLLDCGDTTEGTPFAYYFARKDTAKPNPEIVAFNAMHYDAMAVGNHEFNFGLDEMWKAKRESHFPWLAANVKQTYKSGVPYIRPYIIKNVAGVRVGIVGFVTPGIPRWEIPQHYQGYEFEPIVEAAKIVIPEVRKQVNLLVVIMHSGIDRNPDTGAPPSRPDVENAAWELAEAQPGIDVIFFGHTHRELPEKIVNGVLLSQPKNWGISLARADVAMSKDDAGVWHVKSKHSQTIPVTKDTAPDPDITKLMEPYQAEVLKYLDTRIATSKNALSGEYARYQDEPLLDLIHKVQLEAGHADVSMATIFYPDVKVPAGPVTIREAMAIYTYENLLYTVEMTGARLKDALEHAASFYPAWPVADVQNVRLPGYNADSAQGVSYVIDLTQPVGQRIRDLTFRGAPLSTEQKLRVAINNYRYTGGGGYSVYQGLPIVYRSHEEISELLVDYLKRTKTIPSAPGGNWKIEPPEAVAALEKAADEESKRAPNQ
ncbi:MAG: 5'-nucleotidase C-terminal domain-containing protein [Candidatus Acidiferrales bacterium]|jgi:2',3'-cyclic-nucleotide 2'-phosphodiesterase/3'-nucleotidase